MKYILESYTIEKQSYLATLNSMDEYGNIQETYKLILRQIVFFGYFQIELAVLAHRV